MGRTARPLVACQSKNHLPTNFLFMEQPRDIKREQIKALIERMKQEGKPIDWTTIVLCFKKPSPATIQGRTRNYFFIPIT